MTTKQKRAIWYADRERKLKSIEDRGLMEAYKEFRGKSKNHKIEWFEKSLRRG